jgi:hypothetical protein
MRCLQESIDSFTVCGRFCRLAASDHGLTLKHVSEDKRYADTKQTILCTLRLYIRIHVWSCYLNVDGRIL